MARFHNILFVERAPSHSVHGATCAAVLAHAQGARLTMAGHVGGSAPSLSGNALGEDQSRVVRWWRRRLEELHGVGELHGLDTDTVLLDGNVREAISRQIQRAGHDLVVVIRDTARSNWPLRPHREDRRLLRDGETSVLFLSPRQAPRFPKVLGAVDVTSEEGRTIGREVVGRAAGIARAFDGEVEILHAWTLIGETILASRRRGVSRGRLEALRAEGSERRLALLEELVPSEDAGPLRLSAPHGPVGRTIEHRAMESGADIIVVGRPSGSAVESLFLGTLSEYLLGRIPAAILVVRPRPAEVTAQDEGRVGAEELESFAS